MNESTKSFNGKGIVITGELKDFEDNVLKRIAELPHEELEKFKTLTETRGGRGSSPMWYAVWTGSTLLFDKFMKMQVAFDHPDVVRGKTPLWEAASQGAETMLLALMEKKADVNAKTFAGAKVGDNAGRSVLGIAAFFLLYGFVRDLHKVGAKPLEHEWQEIMEAGRR